MRWDLAINFFIALLAIVNPIAKVPLWIEAAKGENFKVQFRLAILITMTAFVILALFLVLGEEILSFFAIDLPAFKIGGGVIILRLGIQMLDGKAVSINTEKEDTKQPYNVQAKIRYNKVVIPMAVPMIAGPGSISTVIIFSSRAQGASDILLMGGVLIILIFINFLSLISSDKIVMYTGKTFLRVITRLFGLILTAIAVQMIVEGLGAVFPSWLEGASVLEKDN